MLKQNFSKFVDNENNISNMEATTDAMIQNKSNTQSKDKIEQQQLMTAQSIMQIQKNTSKAVSIIEKELRN